MVVWDVLKICNFSEMAINVELFIGNTAKNRSHEQ